ncbi:hypothetical protein Tco_1225841 [Tanacetum coccineum]
MDRRCAAFENGISESFNKAILVPKGKPIITILEEIRLYIMQMLFEMNKLGLLVWKNSIGMWFLVDSKCWKCLGLSGFGSCVHAVAAYMHLNIDIDQGEQQLAQDEEIFREFMEEEARKEEEYARRCREEEEWEAQMDWTEDGNEGNKEGEDIVVQDNPTQPTARQSVIKLVTNPTDSK